MIPASPPRRRTEHWWGVLAGPAAVLGLLLLPLPVLRQDPRAQESWATRPAFPAPLLFTGNEQGSIRPCGCTKPMQGGIDRRGGFVASRRPAGPLVLVSGGDLVTDVGRQQEIKVETFLLALQAMGYDAFAPGTGELRLGADLCLAWRDLATVPWVSLNVTAGGQPLGEPWRRISGRGWVVTGVIDPAAKSAVSGEGVEIVDPVPALRDLLAKTVGPNERLCVLASGGTGFGRDLVLALPGAAGRAVIIVRGSADLPGPSPGVQVADVLFEMGSKGRSVGEIVVESRRVTVRSHPLHESIGTDVAASGLLRNYRESVRAEQLLAAVPLRPAGVAYVGADRCRSCHEEACASLESSRHHRAIDSLRPLGDEHDPECVRCHVTGFGVRGAFVDHETTPDLLNVRCEACHGPGEAHVMTQAPTPGGKVGETACRTCHDPDNSPKFNFDSYWKKIEHR